MNFDLRINGIDIVRNEPLSRHTSFGIGGTAEYFVYVNTLEALCETLSYLSSRNIPYFVMGDGTNLLIADHDFDTVFLKLSGDFRKTEYRDELITCGSAVRLSDLAKETLRAGYGGLETIGSVPGTVGGAAIMNAGVRYYDFSSYVYEIGVADRKGNHFILPKEKCGYSYRESIFQYTDEYIITHATLRLKKCNTEPLWQILQESIDRRKQTQPKGKSAGCFFKNSNNMSSGKLIEECGLKGTNINDAYVANEHGNFIMNRGSATAEDVLALARKIKAEVKKQKGCDLQYEVRIIK